MLRICWQLVDSTANGFIAEHSGWEEPEIAFRNVADEHLPVRPEDRHCGVSGKHVRPFVGVVAVEFAMASRGQTHRDACQILRGRKFTLRDLPGPSAVLNAPMYEIEGIPDRCYVSPVGSRGQIGVGIQSFKGLVDRSRVACGLVSLAFRDLLPGLAQGGYRPQGTRTQSRCRGA